MRTKNKNLKEAQAEVIIVDQILREHFGIEEGVETFIPPDVKASEIIKLIINYSQGVSEVKEGEEKEATVAFGQEEVRFFLSSLNTLTIQIKGLGQTIVPVEEFKNAFHSLFSKP